MGDYGASNAPGRGGVSMQIPSVTIWLKLKSFCVESANSKPDSNQMATPGGAAVAAGQAVAIPGAAGIDPDLGGDGEVGGGAPNQATDSFGSIPKVS